MKLIWV